MSKDVNRRTEHYLHSSIAPLRSLGSMAYSMLSFQNQISGHNPSGSFVPPSTLIYERKLIVNAFKKLANPRNSLRKKNKLYSLLTKLNSPEVISALVKVHLSDVDELRRQVDFNFKRYQIAVERFYFNEDPNLGLEEGLALAKGCGLTLLKIFKNIFDGKADDYLYLPEALRIENVISTLEVTQASVHERLLWALSKRSGDLKTIYVAWSVSENFEMSKLCALSVYLPLMLIAPQNHLDKQFNVRVLPRLISRWITYLNKELGKATLWKLARSSNVNALRRRFRERNLEIRSLMFWCVKEGSYLIARAMDEMIKAELEGTRPSEFVISNLFVNHVPGTLGSTLEFNFSN